VTGEEIQGPQCEVFGHATARTAKDRLEKTRKSEDRRPGIKGLSAGGELPQLAARLCGTFEQGDVAAQSAQLQRRTQPGDSGPNHCNLRGGSYAHLKIDL
jgi:hypothetical protein